MTPEIERLRAEFVAADDAATEARRVAAERLGALKFAVEEWAISDLAARGIEIGKTRVEYNVNGIWRGDHLVVGVGSYRDKPTYRLAKAKKDGTPSAAGNGIWGRVEEVRAVSK